MDLINSITSGLLALLLLLYVESTNSNVLNNVGGGRERGGGGGNDGVGDVVRGSNGLGDYYSGSVVSDKQNFKDNSVLRDSNNNNSNNYKSVVNYQNRQNDNDNNNNNNNNNSNGDDNNNNNGEMDVNVSGSEYSNEKFVSNVISNSNSRSISSSSSSSSSSSTSSESSNFSDESSSLTLTDQVRLLSKQLNALMLRRQEDYKLLENSLKKSVRKYSGVDGIDMDIRVELEQLRHEIKTIREGRTANKEKLTIEWLTQSIAEIRKELTELQEIASNASKDLNRRSQTFEDLATIKNDFKTFKLELESLKHRQERTEVFVRELREEAVQKEEDLRKILQVRNEANKPSGDYVELEADHRMRHQRFFREQIHDLELSQRNLKRQLNEFEYHRFSERIRNLETEQHRLANANFNLSRQIAGLDKLHSSMLELLEDVEGIQNKVDKSVPEIKKEISKLEFTSAQLNSEQSLIREEGHNAAKSIQAMAVSVSALQDDRDNMKDVQNEIKNLEHNFERLQSIVVNAQKSIVKSRTEKMEAAANSNVNRTLNENFTNIQNENNLIKQLESVEIQYESIVNKLPADCSQVEKISEGLYLITPIGQHRPTVAHCSKGWTTIQRRFDGSVDFNRSWEEYSTGFGSPSGEFWMGNEILHHLTADNRTQLKILMQDIYDNTWLALYENFYISSRDDGYRLHVSGYNGNASDALDYQNLMQFSAIDVDRDISNTHCAANYEGGWWFSHCQHANLNGRYNLGLTWFDASRNEWIAVKSSQMMITKRIEDNYDNNSLTTDRTTTTISSAV